MLTIPKAKELMNEQGYDPQAYDFASYSNDIDLQQWLNNEYGIVLRTKADEIGNAKGLIEEIEIKENSKQIIKSENPLRIFFKPCMVGLVGDSNEGKTNLIYWVINSLEKDFNFKKYAYGLRIEINGVKRVFSVQELEQIRNSFIVIDELSSLFDLDNRKVKSLIEKTLRLIYHNNNVILLCGVCENFKKFIAGKLNYVIYKKLNFADLINGSRVKNIIMSYSGLERGSSILDLKKEEAILFDGLHYEKVKIPYLKEYDLKRENVPVFVAKNVQKR